MLNPVVEEVILPFGSSPLLHHLIVPLAVPVLQDREGGEHSRGGSSDLHARP